MCREISRNLGMFLGIFLRSPVERITPLALPAKWPHADVVIALELGAGRPRLMVAFGKALGFTSLFILRIKKREGSFSQKLIS